MRVPNQIGTGPRANAVANASTVAKVRAIGDAEGVAGLGDSNPGELPAAEKFVLKTTAPEKRQGIDVADSKIMALIEIGAASICGDVVGIYERPIEAIRGIIDGMAISICNAQSEISESASRRELQGMIDRVGRILETSDVAEPREWPVGIGVVSTSDAQVYESLSGDRGAARGKKVPTHVRRTVAGGNRFARLVGVGGSRDWMELINISLKRQVRAFAAHVGHCSHDVGRQFPLNVQMPLLDVGPNGLARDGIHGKRKEGNNPAAATNVPVSSYVELRCIERERGRAFERLGVALVAVGVFKEDAISAANRHLAVAFGIESEAEPRCGIKKMTFEAAGVRTGASAGIGEAIHGECSARAAALEDAV